jgi:hypothetical protein
MGFIRTISEGSGDADSRAAGEARLRFITLAATLCLSAGRYLFPHRISKIMSSACVNFETIGRGETVVDFERDLDCQRIWGDLGEQRHGGN